MKRSRHVVIGLLAVVCTVWASAGWFYAAQPETKQRSDYQTAMRNGNFKDAYEGFRKLCLDPETDPRQVASDLNNAIQCLNRLGRLTEFDQFVEETIQVHAKNWRLLSMASQHYLQVRHFGHLVAGDYERGGRRGGGGKMVNTVERDRVRAMQLMVQARPLAELDDSKGEVGQFFLSFARTLLNGRGHSEAWRLQYLSDLTELPDYVDGYPYYRNYNGAPVDEEGQPVFHKTVKRWEDAKTDGERWRWALDQAAEQSAGLRFQVRWEFASFCYNQFGVQTISQGRFMPQFFGLPVSEEDREKNESGTYALHTLKENETIAKLASGIKRFELPDEFNFLKIYQAIKEDKQDSFRRNGYQNLSTIFLNRRQYSQAAAMLTESLAEFPPNARDGRERQLKQITGNWGRFEPVTTQATGQKAGVEFRFRNGKKVHFDAFAVDVPLLLRDVKEYLKSDPGRLDYNRVNINNIGWRLVQKQEPKYLGERVARWSVDLKPRENHFDSRLTVTTPLQKPGAYLVTANMENGNTSKIMIWIADTAIVRKQLNGKSLYYVADAADGRPLPGLNVEFFGYRQQRLKTGRYQTQTANFAEKTNAQGMVTPAPQDLLTNHQWLVTARDAKGRFAYIGFSGVWAGRYYDAQYNATKVFTITDRPVYRPNQTVNFKVWMRRAQYDRDKISQFSGATCQVEIYNPKNEKLYDQALKADDYGGVEGKLELPHDATLGVYRINIRGSKRALGIGPEMRINGGNSFRVEEYKKPEYEVSIDAPTEPVMLGEVITAQVKAKYYFGAPVTNGTVKLKVTRTDHSQQWYPIAPWDWCYGSGYWWFCYDYPWYPGWKDWVGCVRPHPWWFPRHSGPPELVLEQEVALGPEGTVDVQIDTGVAKELHGNVDHQYSITAEVRDESRRTILGQGKVLVARKPFKVFTWVTRGYYRAGDTVKGNFLAQTLDKKPVQGTGELKLLKISYDPQQRPIETAVQTWKLDTDEEGRAEIQFKAATKGQYRLSYRVTDKQEHVIEGGYIFTVAGDGFDGKDFRFNDLELVPEKREYAPGETVRLQVNTNQENSTVLLFTRPANGVYLPPQLLRIKGKSMVVEVDVIKKDMPNFFLEAMTVSAGRVHHAVKEIVVPPEKRILNVAVAPSAENYKPGEEATVDIQLTDATGENFQGSTVVAIYDKAVEYISGGSNVPDIKEFFWKWRRRHNPSHQTNLQRWFNNMTLPRAVGMGDLGMFGRSVVDDLDSLKEMDQQGAALGGGGFGGAPGRPMPAARSAMRKSAAYAAAPQADAAVMESAEGAAMDNMGLNANAVAQDKGGVAGAGLVEPSVRSNFADTALWVGLLTTDATGKAQVSLKMPENLTTWKVKVWGMGHGTKVGSGEVEVVTRKDLLLRLQAPRFFIQKDEVVLSANVHNYLAEQKDVQVALDLPGDNLVAIDPSAVTVTVPANGEKRVDWRVKVVREGTATVRMKALTDVESDAMEMKLPCYVHGILKTEAWAGTVRPDQQVSKLTINVPEQRRIDQSVLEIRYSPSLAGAMVDALPYLAEFPYGCTEQTLNRFLPSVITQKILLNMDLNLAEIRDKRTNLNAQEIGDDRERAAQWKRFDRNPVFDEEELDRMVKEGIKRLTNMQNPDGGWGWFSGRQGRSFPHTTAVVVHGLQIAKQNDVAIVPDVINRGVAWLKRYQEQEVQELLNAPNKVRPWKTRADNIDAFIYMVLVDAGIDHVQMRDFLYRDRVDLAVYAKAMFALALEKQGVQDKLDMLVRNIEQFLVQDAENETAYLKLPASQSWWYWYGSETEANAYYLKLLARVKPESVQASRLVKYLLNNRKHATYWRSTRDTAVCVEAFGDYLRASGETKPDMVVEVWMDGRKLKEVSINQENLFTYDNKFVLTGNGVESGSHEIEIRRQGKGPVYFNTYLTNFTLEDQITRAGLEVKVNRKYYKLVPVDKTIKAAGSRGQAVDQKVEKYERELVKNLDTLKSGDLVEIELEIESKNDYEYLIFEDRKAAGFEPVDVRSGYDYTSALRSYREMRDDRVSFFVRRLPRGRHSVSYRVRAEIPGKFSALPTQGYAMYAPELKGNSDELKVKIVDQD